MKTIRINDYTYLWDSSDGKMLRISQMCGQNPVWTLLFVSSWDLEISPYFWTEQDNGQIFDIDITKSCILYNALLELGQEKVKTSRFVEDDHIVSSPKIVNDSHSADSVTISATPKCIRFSFQFNSTYSFDQVISIKNYTYDVRSDVDKRNSDYKKRFVRVINNCFHQLNELTQSQ